MSFTHYDEMLFSNVGEKTTNKHQNCSQRDPRDKTRHILVKKLLVCVVIVVIVVVFQRK